MKRDTTVDLLRSISLILIMLAHVGMNGSIYSIRAFDVVCMVFLGGMSFSYTAHKETNYFSYLWKRIKKLVIPVYIFYLIYFPIVYFLHLFSPEIVLPKIDTILWSLIFNQTATIGYVWIIRVFLLMALLNPLFYYLKQKIPNTWIHIVLCFISLYSLLILIPYRTFLTPYIKRLYTLYLLYGIGYGTASAFGFHYNSFHKTQKLVISAILASYLLFFVYQNGIIPVTDYKYPPHPYYLSYGILISILLFELLNSPQFESLRSLKIWQWFSKNSLYLYLSHILPVNLVKWYQLPFRNNIFIYFLFVFSFSILTVLLLNFLKKQFHKTTIPNKS